MEEVDIWRTAATLMQLYGEAATSNTAQRADAFHEEGDFDGVVVWLNVVRAIEQLERQTPRDGQAVI